jgi:hypothetical protein
MAGALTHQNARAQQSGDCGYPKIKVIYDDPAELEAACSALADVVAYFQRISFAITPMVWLRFVDHAADRSSAQISTHGYFDALNSQITVYRSADVRPWGLAWSVKLAASFLRHELAHMAVWQILDQNHVRLGREWQEFIAYAIQFDLMDGELRDELLAKHTQTGPVEHLSEINGFTYGMNPELFAVMAYKTYVAKGAGKFIGQLLRAEVAPPAQSYPFPYSPDEGHPIEK